MTTSAAWSRLDALLDGALSRQPHERRRFLDDACRGDALLRAKLEELLDIAEAEDKDLRPGGGLESVLAGEVLDDLAGEADDVAPGTRLGRFELSEFLGAGSVGRVYRARDPTLGREVAIKALAEAFRSDAAAYRRVEREARLLATLNHPNVAGIYGLEVIDGAPYLVLELVRGETLEERLRSGPLSVDDAVDVARQIAAALEEAHRQGVVHRDLKPSNVKFSGPGQVKVLDFGLARYVPPAAADAHADPAVTATGPVTPQGTAPYMSPEQARGLPVDARSDVWAFGCLLYEMLAGRRAFDGRTVADVLAAVMRDDVDWSALPADLPPALRLLIERCLRRDVRQRLQDIGDARLELSELPARGTARPAPGSPIRGDRPGRVVLPWLLAAACLAGLLFVLARREPAPDLSGRVLQGTLQTPTGIELAWDSTAAFALSPDASSVVFRGSDGAEWRLYVRPLDRLEARPLPDTERGVQPFFSPDGRWLAFFADRKLKKVALAGGAPVALMAVPGQARGASWGADGTIVLSGALNSGLARVSAEGVRFPQLTRPDLSRGERSHRWPQVLPGGKTVIFTVDYWGGDPEDATIEAVSMRTGERQVLVRGGAHARFLPPRHLVFARSGTLFAVGFDPERLVVEGTSRPVLEGVRFEAASAGTHIAIADDGTLVYVPGLPVSRERHVAWLGVDGRRTRLPGPPRPLSELRLDPNGRRVAFRMGPRGQSEVWIQQLGSDSMSQITFDLRARRPIWTRDGRHLTVSAEIAGRGQLLSVPVAGGPPRVLHEGPLRIQATDWSPDGRFLALQELHPERGWDLAVLEFDEEGRALGSPRPLVTPTSAHETNPRFSPDGRWFAYESDEGEMTGVYVAPFGQPGEPFNAAREGHWPIWGESTELFYWLGSPNRIQRITWREAIGALAVRADEAVWPRPLPDGPRLPTPIYDFDRSARRFLFLEPPSPATTPPAYQMTLFAGWGEDVKRRLAAGPP